MTTRTNDALHALAQAYGGMENFHKELEQRRKALQNMWSVDPIEKGRVIKAHLFVEYYLNLYLSKVKNYKRNKIDTMMFWQKANVLTKTGGPDFKKMTRPLSRFNKCRNNLAHSLESVLTDSDKRFFESIDDPRFLAWVNVNKKESESKTAIDLYELYATLVVQVIEECLNPRQHLIDDLAHALGQDAVDIYFNTQEDEP